MKKILVNYHSQQFGNTKILALALADGIQKAGGEVLMINTNERRISLEEFIASLRPPRVVMMLVPAGPR